MAEGEARVIVVVNAGRKFWQDGEYGLWVGGGGAFKQVYCSQVRRALLKTTHTTLLIETRSCSCPCGLERVTLMLGVGAAAPYACQHLPGSHIKAAVCQTALIIVAVPGPQQHAVWHPYCPCSADLAESYMLSP